MCERCHQGSQAKADYDLVQEEMQMDAEITREIHAFTTEFDLRILADRASSAARPASGRTPPDEQLRNGEGSEPCKPDTCTREPMVRYWSSDFWVALALWV